MTMIDTKNNDVLSYVRSTGSGAAVVVAMNCTAEAKTISLDVSGAGVAGTKVKTLATDAASLKSTSTLTSVTLPPFASWVASVE
jgi:alpha-glucosidase